MFMKNGYKIQFGWGKVKSELVKYLNNYVTTTCDPCILSVLCAIHLVRRYRMSKNNEKIGERCD